MSFFPPTVRNTSAAQVSQVWQVQNRFTQPPLQGLRSATRLWCFVVAVAFFGTKRMGIALSFHPEAHLNVCPRPYYSAAVSLTPCSHVWFDESLPGSEKSLPNTVTMHSNSLPSIVTCCLSLLQTPTHCTEITQHWFVHSSDSRLDLIPYI